MVRDEVRIRMFHKAVCYDPRREVAAMELRRDDLVIDAAVSAWEAPFQPCSVDKSPELTTRLCTSLVDQHTHNELVDVNDTELVVKQ